MNASKMKEQNFIKCNYIEELARSLSYLYIKQFPNAFLMSIYKPGMDASSTKWFQISEDNDRYESILCSINNGEIPIDLVSIFQNYSDIFVFNLCVILKKELMSDTNAGEPILSTFAILNPTVSVINFLVKTIVNEITHIRNEIPIENELHFEMSALLEEFKQSILKEEKKKIKKYVKEQNKSIRESGVKVRKKSEKQNKEEQIKKKNKKKPIEKVIQSEVESKLYSVISGPLHLEDNKTPNLNFKHLASSYKTSSKSKPLSCETRSNITPEVGQKETWHKTSFKHITQSTDDIDVDDFLNFSGELYNYFIYLPSESSDFGVKKVHDECSKNVNSDIHNSDDIHGNDKQDVSNKGSFAKEGCIFFDHNYNKNLPIFKNVHDATATDKEAGPPTKKSRISANHIPPSAVEDRSSNQNPILGHSNQESLYFIQEISDQSDNELPSANSGATFQIASQPIIKEASSTKGSNIDEEEYKEEEEDDENEEVAAFSNISSD